MTFTFTGGTELAARLNAMGSELSKPILVAALKDAAEPIRSTAALLAPKSAISHKHLADHIGVSVIRQNDEETLDGDETAVAIGPTRNVFWGGFNEFGTRKLSARPFLRPALDQRAQIALDRLGRALWTAIRAAAPETFSGGGISAGTGLL